MKVILVSADQTEVNELLDQARKDDLLLQTADGSEFHLCMVDDFDLEIVRTRRNERLVAFLEERARQPGAIPLEEVKRRLDLD
jgi:hypothetical protein